VAYKQVKSASKSKSSGPFVVPAAKTHSMAPRHVVPVLLVLVGERVDEVHGTRWNDAGSLVIFFSFGCERPERQGRDGLINMPMSVPSHNHTFYGSKKPHLHLL